MTQYSHDQKRAMRKQKKSRESQDKILTHAAKVIAEEGFEKASIRKIAADMGMSISALYYYFESKEEVLFSLQFRSFNDLLERLGKKMLGIEDPEQQLYVLIENHLDFFLQRLNELTICSHETKTLKGEAYERVWRIRKRYYNITHGIVQTIMRKNPKGFSNPSLATLNLFGMLNWIYMWFDPTRDRSPQGLAEEIHHLFLRGIKSDRPHSERPTKEVSERE